MNNRALTFKQLQAEKIKLSRAWVWKLEQEGKFPKRRRMGARIYWMEDEVDQWLKEQLGQQAA